MERICSAGIFAPPWNCQLRAPPWIGLIPFVNFVYLNLPFDINDKKVQNMYFFSFHKKTVFISAIKTSPGNICDESGENHNKSVRYWKILRK